MYKGITLSDAVGLNLECDLILLLSPVTEEDWSPVVIGTSDRQQKGPEHEHDCRIEFDAQPGNLTT